MHRTTLVAILMAIPFLAPVVAQEHPPEKPAVEALIKEAMELLHQEGLDPEVMELGQDLLHQGMALFHEGHLEEAREHLNRGLDQLRSARRAPAHLRELYLRALEHARKLELDPLVQQLARDAVERARVHQEQGHLEEASRLVRHAVQALKERAHELGDLRPQHDEDQLWPALRELDPELAEHLQWLREREPEHYQAELRRAFQEVEELEKLREENPEQFELTREDRRLCREADRLAEQCRRSEGPGREELRSNLNDVVTRLFDLRLARMEREIKHKERELVEVERMLRRQLEVLHARSEHRGDLIRRRVLEYLGETDLEDW